MKVNAYLTDGFETVEALAVIDILRRAGIDTETVSVTGELEVKSAQNIPVRADRLFDKSAEEADVIFLPGGPGSLAFEKMKDLKEVVVSHNAEGKIIAAICAAPSVLGHWGLLKGKNATCFPGFEKDLTGAKVQKAPARVVADGNIFTARGMGTAIDLGLALVGNLLGEDKAEHLGVDIQYID